MSFVLRRTGPVAILQACRSPDQHPIVVA